MTTMENPVLSLTRLNDLESKIIADSATSREYEELDILIASIGGEANFLKNVLIENGIVDFEQYILERKKFNGDKIAMGKIFGSITGALDFLKNYTIKNNFN